MNSSNNTQTQPINPLVVVQRQRQALAQHSKKEKKMVKCFKKYVRESLNDGLDLIDEYLLSRKVYSVQDTEQLAPVSKFRKEKKKFHTYVLNKNKEQSLIYYNKINTFLNDWLEYAMENLKEGDMLEVADICKQEHAIILCVKEKFEWLDSNVGYWKV